MNEDEFEEWWTDISEELLEEFIFHWLAEIDLDNEEVSIYGGKVVLMNMLASDVFQWKFIIKSFSLATDASHLETIAAGPLEHLLANHGEKWIDKVEGESLANENFSWMMTGVWKNSMTEDVWSRVQKIQSYVESSEKT
jgi:hypothetical protein